MDTRLKDAIHNLYDKGYEDASEKASFYLYHLCAHPKVDIDPEELIAHFKNYMKNEKSRPNRQVPQRSNDQT